MKNHSFGRFLFLALLLDLLPAVLPAQAPIFPGENWEKHLSWTDAGYDESRIREIRRFITDSMNTTGLYVVVDGKELFRFGDIEELSYLASCRKSILAMMYGNYIADGTINPETTLEELGFDDIQGLMPKERKATVRHLITARSGIYHPASNAGDNSADAPERGSQQPGSYFLYNNWDFNAAGAAFEKLTGRNIYDAMETDIARPIGMQDWDREAQKKSGDTNKSKYQAYHVWLSTRDMARIGQLMLHEGNWNGNQIIPEEWAREIVSVVTPLEEMNPARLRDGYFGYGYMWWVWDGPEAEGPFEGAYTARGAIGQYITVLPKLGMVIAHKTKSAYGRSTGWKEYEKLVRLFVDSQID
jgi:CubicO group peptidase (beta-lactamase class C family)